MIDTPFTKSVDSEIVGGIPGRNRPVPVDESFTEQVIPTVFPTCKHCGAVALKGQSECGKCKAIRVHNETLAAEEKMRTERMLAEIKDRVQELETQVAVLSLLTERIDSLERSLGIGEPEEALPVAQSKDDAPLLD